MSQPVDVSGSTVPTAELRAALEQALSQHFGGPRSVARLAPRRLGTATCYGAVVDERLGRYWLFLERVAGVELYQVGELSTWQRAACWLAGLHTQLAVESDGFAPAARLLTYDDDFYRQWPR